MEGEVPTPTSINENKKNFKKVKVDEELMKKNNKDSSLHPIISHHIF